MKRVFGIFVLIMALLSVAACGALLPQEVHVATERAFVMDTLAEVQIFYLDTPSMQAREAHRELAAQAMDIIRQMDEILDKHREGSDIWRVNNAGGSPVEVSSYTVEVLERSVYLRVLTGGAFDITIGAVTDLWSFTGEDATPPDGVLVAAALETVGTEIYISGNVVQLSHPDAKIDLGAVGKGFAADVAAEFLRGHGVAAIINMGGDIVTVGERPGGTPWRLGLQAPFADISQIIGAVEVGQAGVASSGSYHRFFHHNGALYHHILNPATGFPVNNGIASVSAIAPNGILAEGLSTAVFVLGVTDGLALIEALDDVYVVIILDDGTTLYSPGLYDRIFLHAH